MTHPRIAAGDPGHGSVLETEAHAVALDPLYRRRGTVDQAGTGIVARPADPVAGAELHRDAVVDLDGAFAAARRSGAHFTIRP